MESQRKELFRRNLSDLMRRKKINSEQLGQVLSFDRDERKWLKRVTALGLARPNKATAPQLDKMAAYFQLSSSSRFWTVFQTTTDLSFVFELADRMKELKTKHPKLLDDAVWKQLRLQTQRELQRWQVVNNAMRELLRIVETGDEANELASLRKYVETKLLK